MRWCGSAAMNRSSGPGGDGGAEQPPLGRVQVLGLVHQDVPVARRLPASPEQAGGLVGQLHVGGLAGRGELGGDLLGGLPDQAALGLGERAAPAGAQAGQVGLLGVQVLGQDDLLPLVLQERRGEGRARRWRRPRPSGGGAARSSAMTGVPRASLTMR